MYFKDPIPAAGAAGVGYMGRSGHEANMSCAAAGKADPLQRLH